MEACLLSISNSNIAEIAQKTPNTANVWKKFKANIQKPIAVILIINTLAHTIGAAISGAQFDELYGPKWIWLFSIAYSLFMIQYTEILPKTLGVRFNIFLAKTSAVPFQILIKVFGPFTALIEFLNRPFEFNRAKTSNSVVSEISLLASSAVYDKSLSPEQATLISKSIRMSMLKAREVMVEKDDVLFLSDSMSLADAFLAAHIHRHTRYPLIQGHNWGNILGYVNFKDIVTALHVAPADPSLIGICRPILFILEDMPLHELLKKMIREHHHIAIVNDMHQNAIGLVAFEDVIESLVGDIEDEFDEPPEMIVNVSEKRWRVGGGVSMSTLRRVISEEIPDIPQNINDLVKSHLENQLLTENTEVHSYGMNIKVRRVARNYVYDAIIIASK
jgi:CBS domain containing-hemolysin-like protein